MRTSVFSGGEKSTSKDTWIIMPTYGQKSFRISGFEFRCVVFSNLPSKMLIKGRRLRTLKNSNLDTRIFATSVDICSGFCQRGARVEALFLFFFVSHVNCPRCCHDSTGKWKGGRELNFAFLSHLCKYQPVTFLPPKSGFPGG